MNTILQAALPAHLDLARQLFREYAASIGVDLCFQRFDEELSALPGDYAPPRGRLLLAWEDGALAGCGALRSLGEQDCEMKRLYVRPQFRGRCLGRRLAERLVEAARGAGYRSMFLDTLASMVPARRLYLSLGFRETAPYYSNPLPDVVFMKLDLSEPEAGGGHGATDGTDDTDSKRF
ncbi:MAG: GNAT family N-acetyltransferase [Verrucomicrobia bacterium]|nr:GNAT family N-acetyltransferase [Verrucomicrobiota bacterium]